MAGESAEEVARRRLEKAERLARQAELFARGAEGERRTAEALAQLPAGEWVALHDRRWPGRQVANIDHLVVGPGGIFVIDSKCWSGTVTLADGVLRQNGRSRRPAVARAAESAAAVAAVLPPELAALVQPVLCFTDRSGPVGRAGDVLVCTAESVAQLLTSRTPRLPAAEVQQAAIGLRALLASAVRDEGAEDSWSSRRSAGPSARRWAAQPGRRSAGPPGRCSAGPPGRRSAGPRARSRSRATETRRRGPTPAGQLVRLALVLSAVAVIAAFYGEQLAALPGQVIDGLVNTTLDAEPRPEP